MKYASDLRLKRLANELAGVALGQAMSAIGTLIGLRLLTRAMGAHEYGVLALALTAPSLIGLVVYAGPGQAVIRFYTAAADAGERSAFLRAAWLSVVWRTVALLGICAVGAVIAAMITHSVNWWSLALAALVNGILTAFTTIVDGFQNALRHRFIVAWHGALGVWMRFGMALMLFHFLAPTGVVALWGYTIASGIVFASQFAFYAWHLRGAPPDQRTSGDVRHWRRRVDAFSWPFSVFGVVAWIQTSSERWSLAAFATTAVVGEYAALSQLGMGITALLSNVMLQLGLPIFYQRAGDGSDAQAVRAAYRLNMMFLAMTGLATLGLVFVSAAFHREIFQLTVANTFLPVSRLLPLMMLSGGLLACAQVASGFLLTSTESHRLIMPKAVSSFAGAAAMIVGARYAGIVGVVVASIFASFLHLVLILASARVGTRTKVAPRALTEPDTAPALAVAAASAPPEVNG